MKWIAVAIILTFTLIVSSGCGQENKANSSKELTISAAASLKDSMMEIAKAYKSQHPDSQLDFNFGGSGTLRQQIAQGAPVDLFLAASESDVNALVANKKIISDTATPFLGNVLVLIAPKQSDTKDLKSLIQEKKRLAIATPKAAPAGDYAKEALTHLNLWKDAQENLVYGKDVRHVLTLVEEKSVEGGIVYNSDALVSNKVKVVEKVNPTAYSSIIYDAGVVSGSKQKTAAKAFLNYLQGTKAQQIFKKYGFASPKK
ncbi:molybdate ABC transporter substrate-binding protein [Pullulanibacillus camelliae]|uniref:Molybdate ABC transporter substrate-binding protein n=1 Tax=Pullulanibacillus camelliae TaxID=1707096 RepID=A0A8J2YLM5_9BACL|nr:molybdate ABC transporter substrate-binding protein [Pullulanibacillus camelliae]GGE50462.1 molybdate ABC transporter substrate-binding protein [Pullulanibacillus camelliae]